MSSSCNSDTIALRHVVCSKAVTIQRKKVSAYKKVVSWITNNCVEQSVIVIVNVAYENKFEQWHISSANNKESLIKTKTNICFYLVCN